MSHLGHLTRAGWIIVGLVSGLVVAPVGALAATQLVQIVGTNGTTKANVTPAHQLQTAEAAPSSLRMYKALPGFGSCTKVVTLPSSEGFVLKHVVFDVIDSSGPSNVQAFYLSTNSSLCQGSNFVSIHPLGINPYSISLGTGVAFAPGTTLYCNSGSHVRAWVYLYGYGVPPAAV
jgi:hypothetical protein